MAELQKIRCPYCNEFVCNSYGEVERECDRCKRLVHAVVTQLGVIYFDENMPRSEIRFKIKGKTVGKITGINRRE